MDAALVAQLLAQFGPSAVKLIDALIVKIQQKGQVSPEEWTELRVHALQTGRDRMLLALKAANIDPESDQGKAFLAMTVV